MEKNNKKKKNVDANILIIGNSGVGKTLLCERIVNGGNGLDQYQTEVTIGPEFVFVEYDFGTGRPYCVRFVDVPGAATARTLVKSYYRGIDGIIAVYDVTEVQTFHALRDDWLPVAGDLVGKVNTPVLVVANKTDVYKRGERKLKQLVEEHTRDLSVSFHDRLIFDNLVAASAKVWAFPDKETPVDAFVKLLIKKQAERHGDDDMGRISLFSRDVEYGSSSNASNDCAC